MLLKVEIITPDGPYHDYQAKIINVRSIDGNRGLLPNHVPLVLMLDVGKLEIVLENDERLVFACGQGMLYNQHNVCKLMVSAIESTAEIDLQRALEAKKRASKRLHDDKFDQVRVQAALKRALNRIDIKEKYLH